MAVLLVLLFHLWPDRLPGGYIGVDVFFVISGFLITSHIVREVDRTGSVNLAGFWARRIRRLLPAAYVVLLVSAVGVLVWVPQLVWQQFFGEILAAALYVENWRLALDSVNYLAAENAPSPAQHYWTLSAEEQFYLVWPLLVLLGLWLAGRGLKRRSQPDPGHRRTVVLAVLAITTAASLTYSLWITSTDPAWAYFVTPARAWEFGAGALLAFAPPAARRLGPRARAGLGWVALVGLLACSLVFDASTPFPGTAALWVVAATMALIWVESPQVSWASSRLLVLRPARFLGDISYAIYLWHWPLIILLPYVTDHPLTTLDRFSVLLATIGASALTRRWVEDPVRAARRFGLARPRNTFAYAVAGAVVLTAVCVVPRVDVARDNERTAQAARDLVAESPPCFGAAARDPKAKGCPNPELENVMVPTPAAAQNDYPQYSECYHQMYRAPLVPCHFGKRKAGVPHVAVIGDSHARVLMTMVEEMVDAGQLTADLMVIGDCPWSTTPPNMGNEIGQSCARFRDQLAPLLERTADQYDFILTTARVNTMRGNEEERVAGLVEAWAPVASRGTPVVVLRDNPEGSGPRNPNLCLADVAVHEANSRCALDRGEFLDDYFDALSVAARRTPGAKLIDLTSFFCDERECPVVIGGVNVYADNNHLSVTYAKTLAPYLHRELTGLRLLEQ
ncbi:MAG: oatA 3 [Marmoricola sp.]|nr:oatA 3 [Marmoricola sp.]